MYIYWYMYMYFAYMCVYMCMYITQFERNVHVHNMYFADMYMFMGPKDKNTAVVIVLPVHVHG